MSRLLVDDVNFFCQKLMKYGGSLLGDIVETKIEGVGTLTAVYSRDPG